MNYLLNENELKALIIAADQIIECTAGQFGYLQDAGQIDGMTVQQMKGYFGQLAQKKMIDVSNDEFKQLMLTTAGAEAVHAAGYHQDRSFEVIDGEWVKAKEPRVEPVAEPIETITNTNGADNASCPKCGHYNAMLGGWGDKEPATCRDCGYQAYVVEPVKNVLGTDRESIAGNLALATNLRDYAAEVEAGTKHKCDNCGFEVTTDGNGIIIAHDSPVEQEGSHFIADEYGLHTINKLHTRLDPSGIVPSGQCPDCGALAYLVTPNPDVQPIMPVEKLYGDDWPESAHETIRRYRLEKTVKFYGGTKIIHDTPTLIRFAVDDEIHEIELTKWNDRISHKMLTKADASYPVFLGANQ